MADIVNGVSSKAAEFDWIQLMSVSLPVQWIAPKKLKSIPGVQSTNGIDLSMEWASGNWEGSFCSSKSFASDIFISVITTLAHSRPDVLRKVFDGQMFGSKPSREGGPTQPNRTPEKFWARLWFKGAWNLMEIDEMLPCRMNGQLLSSYAISPKPDTYFVPWISFLEKALATVFGGYGCIHQQSFETIIR